MFFNIPTERRMGCWGSDWQSKESGSSVRFGEGVCTVYSGSYMPCVKPAIRICQLLWCYRVTHNNGRHAGRSIFQTANSRFRNGTTPTFPGLIKKKKKKTTNNPPLIIPFNFCFSGGTLTSPLFYISQTLRNPLSVAHITSVYSRFSL